MGLWRVIGSTRLHNMPVRSIIAFNSTPSGNKLADIHNRMGMKFANKCIGAGLHAAAVSPPTAVQASCLHRCSTYVMHLMPHAYLCTCHARMNGCYKTCGSLSECWLAVGRFDWRHYVFARFNGCRECCLCLATFIISNFLCNISNLTGVVLMTHVFMVANTMKSVIVRHRVTS
eukprot:1160550-Pelagomonas_calceolata.AAC.2